MDFSALKLKIPQNKQGTARAGMLKKAQLVEWIQELPFGDPLKAGNRLLQLLVHLNRTPYSLGDRIEFTKLLRPCVDKIVDALKLKAASAVYPLNADPQKATKMVQGLLMEMASSYKVMLNGMASKYIHKRKSITAIVFDTMTMLSKVVVGAYSNYTVEPVRVWLEIHSLYRFACQHRFHNARIDNRKYSNTIDLLYKRIILLATANPYHLMQGEAEFVYRHTARWCQALRFVPLKENQRAPKGVLVIDFNLDMPPTYAPICELPIAMRQAVAMDLKLVCETVKQERDHALARNQTQVVGFEERLGQEMLSRLVEAWGVRLERLTPRVYKSCEMMMISGLSASHHLLSGAEPFVPDQDENRLREHLPIDLVEDGRLCLVKKHEKPWGLEQDNVSQYASKAAASPSVGKASYQVVDNTADVWLQAYPGSGELAYYTIADNTQVKYAKAIRCRQRDENRDGISIFASNAYDLKLRVGDLVIYSPRKEKKAPIQRSSVGVIRWMRLLRNKSVEAGVRKLADSARAVAVKGLKGVGADSAYVRSILLPDLDYRKHPLSVIVPAALYDVGSHVVINTGEEIFTVRFNRVLASTRHFTRYGFESINNALGQ